MSDGEKFKIVATVVDVHDVLRTDLNPPRVENGITLELVLDGHPDISERVFLEVMDLDPEVLERAIKKQIEASTWPIAMKFMRKQRGDLTGKLQFLKGASFSKEDCCFDCVKRQLGILPPELPPEFVETL